MDNLKKFNAMEGNQSKELALQHARLMEKVEDLPPGTVVAPEVCAKIERLQAELRNRLRYLLVNNAAPIFITASGETEGIQKELMIPFHFDVFSSMNVKIDKFKIEAPTKDKAWLKAREKSREYPGKVKLKIS